MNDFDMQAITEHIAVLLWEKDGKLVGGLCWD